MYASISTDYDTQWRLFSIIHNGDTSFEGSSSGVLHRQQYATRKHMGGEFIVLQGHLVGSDYVIQHTTEGGPWNITADSQI
jgi:hypothetical protein